MIINRLYMYMKPDDLIFISDFRRLVDIVKKIGKNILERDVMKSKRKMKSVLGSNCKFTFVS